MVVVVVVVGQEPAMASTEDFEQAAEAIIAPHVPASMKDQAFQYFEQVLLSAKHEGLWVLTGA